MLALFGHKWGGKDCIQAKRLVDLILTATRQGPYRGVNWLPVASSLRTSICLSNEARSTPSLVSGLEYSSMGHVVIPIILHRAESKLPAIVKESYRSQYIKLALSSGKSKRERELLNWQHRFLQDHCILWRHGGWITGRRSYLMAEKIGLQRYK